MNTFTIKESLAHAWFITKNHFWFILGTLLIAYLAPAIIVQVVAMAGVGQFALNIISLAAQVAGIILGIGFVSIIIKLYKNETVAVGELFQHSNLFLKFFVAQILSGLIILAGFILLIIPGIYLMLRLYPVMFLVVDEKLGPIDAISRSFAMTKNHAGDIFIFTLALMGINILGVLCFFVGLVVTIPLTWVAMVCVYFKLKNASLPVAPVENAPHIA
jgi:uncharacterized membrane protein